MKAKYKFGMLVEFNVAGGMTDRGVIDAILFTETSKEPSYRMKLPVGTHSDTSTFVPQSKITQSYRPVTERTRKKTTTTKTSTSRQSSTENSIST